MAKVNTKATDYRLDPTERVAGGMGAPAARQDPAALLRRAVLANLLWENLAYEKGDAVAAEIARLGGACSAKAAPRAAVHRARNGAPQDPRGVGGRPATADHPPTR